MLLKNIVIALGLASTACAHPRHKPKCPALPEGVYRPALEGEVRSPCPMLNVLANHGFLPRDGKNITRDVCRRGMELGLNVTNEFADIMFEPALLTNPTPNSQTFDLDMLNTHRILEHDGSLSRADAYWDKSQVFNSSTYLRTLSILAQGENVTLETAAAARLAAVEFSQSTNPQFYLNSTNEAISLGESAAYMLALEDPATGQVPLGRVRMMFEEEKLPYELGWTATNRVTNSSDLFQMTQRIIDSTNWPSKLKARANAGFHGGIISKRGLV